MKPIVLIVGLALLAGSALRAQEWTRFRGPNGTGISHAKTIPERIERNDINWRIELPGSGHSSPVLWGDRIFLTTAGAEAGSFTVLCVNAPDGKVLWQRHFPHVTFRQHKFNSYASATPAVDAERVYVAYTVPASHTLLALDHDGKTVWERDLGPYKSQHGSGASPMLHEGMVVLGNEQDGTSFIIGVDAKTGQTAWQTPRRSAAAAYATACLYEPKNGQPALVFTSEAEGIYGLHPKTGKVLWEFPQAFDKRSVSSAVIAGDIIFGSCGSGGGGNFVTAIRPGDGTSTKAELAYHLRKSAPYVPTSVAVGDLVWLWSDGGILTCLHAPTGDIRYQERVGGNFFGSPVWVDGTLYAVSTAGEIVTVQASEEFKVISRFPLDDTCHTTPAIAGGKMYIRTEKSLVSIGGGKDS